MAIVRTDTGLNGKASGAEPQSDMNQPQGRTVANHPRWPVFWMRKALPASGSGAEPGASAQAIISEIEACAARFAATGEMASIDLRFMKTMPAEREMLSGLLGRGEVSAVVDVLGRTEIQETSIPCVWWISHRNGAGEVVGELIEITGTPDLIQGERSSVAGALEARRAEKPFCEPHA
ncbi:MAG TPA: hydrogenase expression/formation C-terminal domain-containing protein [Gallionella sp.]|nr:hydrogenase expression/formation C-terminal domain-containing protein [Gallionella sp.]